MDSPELLMEETLRLEKYPRRCGQGPTPKNLHYTLGVRYTDSQRLLQKPQEILDGQ